MASDSGFPRAVVVLTGAGISAESGLGTFRDKDGIWTKYPIEDLATLGGFRRDRAFVNGFYNARRAQLKTAKAHAGHVALARLQAECDARGSEFLLVTQNVDNLHEQAGSNDVLHMHGELMKIRCETCHSVMMWPDDIDEATGCAACGGIGVMRPHVVWFGEMPLEMDRIELALASCDLFLSIGTSGTVYPAAGFVRAARFAGAHTAELNLEASDGGDQFHAAHYGKASLIVPEYVDRLIRA